jgi:hypothetical protein
MILGGGKMTRNQVVKRVIELTWRNKVNRGRGRGEGEREDDS